MSDLAHFAPFPANKVVDQYRRQMTRKAFNAWWERRATLSMLDPATAVPPEKPPYTREYLRWLDRVGAKSAERIKAGELGMTVLHLRTSQYKPSGIVYDRWRARGCKAHGPRPIEEGPPRVGAGGLLLASMVATATRY